MSHNHGGFDRARGEYHVVNGSALIIQSGLARYIHLF